LSYIRERNSNVARHIAKHLGISFDDTLTDYRTVQSYIVPSKTIQLNEAHRMGICTVDDFYGGAVRDLLHVSKTVLHNRVGRATDGPAAYSPSFAATVSDIVLPGFAFFTIKEGYAAFNELSRRGYLARLKRSDESGGAGQNVVLGEKHMTSLLKQIDQIELRRKGLVLETNLNACRTVSAGIFFVDGQVYSQLACQKDIQRGDRTIYGGAVMKICRGGFENLFRFGSCGENVELAIRQARSMHEAMGYFDPLLSRASYDVLQGETSNGEFLSGVTDITCRLGGSSPAEVLALDYFRRKPGAMFVDADVTLDYNPVGVPGQDDVVFLDQPTLRITAKLLEVDKQAIFY